MTAIPWNPDLRTAPSGEVLLILFSDGDVRAGVTAKPISTGHPCLIWDGHSRYSYEQGGGWVGDLYRPGVGYRDKEYARPVAWAVVRNLGAAGAAGAARAIIEAAAAKAERERMEGGHA